jgi:hypothetical protein
MLQTTPDQLNQKHTSSIENIFFRRVEIDEATAPPSVNELNVWLPRTGAGKPITPVSFSAASG